MNEIQIIQKQLATERAHFDEVAQVCASRLAGADRRGADSARARGSSADGRSAGHAGAGGGSSADGRSAGHAGAGGSSADGRSAGDTGAGDSGADGRSAGDTGAGDSGADGKFAAACADYFAFAVTRFDAPKAQQLATQLAGGPRREFLQAFTEASRTHFERLDAMLTGNLPVTEWRAVSRIDADSIFAERMRYSRVKATIPP